MCQRQESSYSMPSRRPSPLFLLPLTCDGSLSPPPHSEVRLSGAVPKNNIQWVYREGDLDVAVSETLRRPPRNPPDTCERKRADAASQSDTAWNLRVCRDRRTSHDTLRSVAIPFLGLSTELNASCSRSHMRTSTANAAALKDERCATNKGQSAIKRTVATSCWFGSVRQGTL